MKFMLYTHKWKATLGKHYTAHNFTFSGLAPQIKIQISNLISVPSTVKHDCYANIATTKKLCEF